jgi:transposase InsO family protein
MLQDGGFIDHDMNLLPDEEPFIRKLAENLIFYNTKRAHKELGNMTPIQYLIHQGVLSQMCLTSTKA